MRAADEAGLPGDPGFRAALTGYLVWDSRMAAAGPASGATVPAAGPASGAGMPAAEQVPRWDWGPPGPPAAQDAGAPDADEPAVVLPAPGAPVSFDTHVKGLFRSRDRDSMMFAFDLWSRRSGARRGDSRPAP